MQRDNFKEFKGGFAPEGRYEAFYRASTPVVLEELLNSHRGKQATIHYYNDYRNGPEMEKAVITVPQSGPALDKQLELKTNTPRVRVDFNDETESYLIQRLYTSQFQSVAQVERVHKETTTWLMGDILGQLNQRKSSP